MLVKRIYARFQLVLNLFYIRVQRVKKSKSRRVKSGFGEEQQPICNIPQVADVIVIEKIYREFRRH